MVFKDHLFKRKEGREGGGMEGKRKKKMKEGAKKERRKTGREGLGSKALTRTPMLACAYPDPGRIHRTQRCF